MDKPQQPQHKRTRRDDIFLFIMTWASDHVGNTPSLGEIARKFGIRRSTAYTHTLKLVNDGRAKWKDGELILEKSEYFPPTDIR